MLREALFGRTSRVEGAVTISILQSSSPGFQGAWLAPLGLITSWSSIAQLGTALREPCFWVLRLGISPALAPGVLPTSVSYWTTTSLIDDRPHMIYPSLTLP